MSGLIGRGRPRSRLLVALCLCVTFLVGTQLTVAQGDACAEPNDDPLTACTLTSGVGSRALIDHPRDVDAYRIEIGEPSAQVQVDLIELPADYDLYLADAHGGVYGQSVQEGTASEHLRLTLRQGTYYVYVQADPGREIDVARTYALGLSVEAIASFADHQGVLLADDFDDVTRGVLPIASRRPELFTTGYEAGEYSIVNFDHSGRIWGPILPGRYADSVISARVRFVGTSSDRLIAMACRRQEMPDESRLGSMYRMHVVPSTRQLDLVLWHGEVRRVLVSRRSVAAIQPDDAWNHLELSCIKSTITARANGEVIAVAEDSTHSAGAHVIGVGSRLAADRRAEARFDDLTVTRP